MRRGDRFTRTSIALALFLTLGIAGCDDHCPEPEPCQSQGRITGPDLRLCACCGGYFIEIEGQTYRFGDLPPGSDVDLSRMENFPIDVCVDWEPVDNPCMGDEIEIITIEELP